MSLTGNNILGGASGQTTGYDIDQSLRFEDGDSAYLSRAQSNGNQDRWTWSGWVKRGNLGSNQCLFATSDGVATSFDAKFTSSDTINVYNYLGGGFGAQLITNRVFRDVSSWYHIVIVYDSGNATEAHRLRIYINGVEESSFSTTNYPSVDENSDLNVSGSGLDIGRQKNGAEFFDGYLAEVHLIDGTALTPASFGETNLATNQWIPLEATGLTYGTNGFYLKFQDSSALGDDSSGNTNDFTATNLAATDQVLDSPTNNFCTMNPLAPQAHPMSEGNLWVSTSVAESSSNTFGMDSGKWYFEVLPDSSSFSLGIVNDPNIRLDTTSSHVVCVFDNGGTVSTPNSTEASDTFSSGSSGDIYGFAIDADAKTLDVYQNNTKVIEATSFTIDAPYFLSVDRNTSATVNHKMNFGADSSFAGTKTAQGNGDDGEDFYYTPPTGYKALNTDNLDDPAIALPTDHFNSILWTGSGTSPRSFTGVGFTPDLVWTKNRTTGVSHMLYDTVRGAGSTKSLESNATLAEGGGNQATYGYLSAFGSDGFTTTDGSGSPNYYFNENTKNFVAWNWKAGGAASSNGDGSIDSSVSANPTAGFSVLTYTGNETAGATVGHGLSQAPELVINKVRGSATQWYVNATAVSDTSNKVLTLNATDALSSGTLYFNDTDPTATLITLGSYGNLNSTGSNVIYCWHSVEGYSKVGTYVGNGVADGPMIYTGFRPALFIVKNASTGSTSWRLYDDKRPAYNPADLILYPDTTGSESGTGHPMDFVSNGIKNRGTFSEVNTSGDTYIYLAIAESPFKTSNAR